MTRNLCILILIWFSSVSYSQKESKDGYKKVYLDSYFALTDSANAYYFAYGYFDNGNERTNVSYMSNGLYDFTVVYDGLTGDWGAPVILNGTITFTDSRTSSHICYFKDGYLQSVNETAVYSEHTSYRTRSFDTLYQGEPGSSYFEYKSNHYNYTGWYRTGKYGWLYYPETDTRGVAYMQGKYPYFKGHVPHFIGLAAGVEGFRTPGYELGIGLHLTEIQGDLLGGMGGFIFSYKGRFDKSYYSLNAEMGAYLPLSLAVGYSYHNNGLDDMHTFRLSTGITLFHAQLLYGYTFFRNSKNEIPELYHHSLTLRYVLPTFRIGP